MYCAGFIFFLRTELNTSCRLKIFLGFTRFYNSSKSRREQCFPISLRMQTSLSEDIIRAKPMSYTTSTWIFDMTPIEHLLSQEHARQNMVFLFFLLFSASFILLLKIWKLSLQYFFKKLTKGKENNAVIQSSAWTDRVFTLVHMTDLNRMQLHTHTCFDFKVQ